MKTIKEMRDELNAYCKENCGCTNCPHEGNEFCNNHNFDDADGEIIAEWHKLFFPEQHDTDPVNHPSHYTKGKIEVADFIADQKLNFDRGNAVKYVCRAGSKDPDKEIQDLEKAIWYINHEIKMLKGDAENGTKKEN